MDKLQREWAEANSAWLQSPTPDTEKRLEQAADALRRARRIEHVREGVTDAELRETLYKDEEQ